MTEALVVTGVLSALFYVMAWLCARHRVDPVAVGFLILGWLFGVAFIILAVCQAAFTWKGAP